MSSTINEQTQYVDSSGKPLVGGFLYIGTVNTDAKANTITIFSDRELSVSISNPQTLDANGRTTNKIWVPGKYSLLVENLSNVQQYAEQDNGETASTGITSISSVSGANTITGNAAETITAYVDKELYTLVIASVNTGPVTANFDDVGAKSVVKNFDKAIDPGNFQANQSVIVMFNSTNDNFEWVNQNAETISFYEGTPVVSAATTDIWAEDGNTLHITGTTGCTSFGTAPHVGARRTLIYDGIVALTNSTNMALQGAADYTTAAGDVLEVYADTTTQFDITIHPKDGKAIISDRGLIFIQSQSASNSASIDFTTNIDSTFDHYILECLDVVPATDGAFPWFRTSTNASTFDTGASDYSHGVVGMKIDASIASNLGGDDTAAQILLMGTELGMGSAAGESMNCIIDVYSPSSTTFTLMEFSTVGLTSNAPETNAYKGWGVRQSAADVDGFQFLFSTGNITSGTFILYGVAKS